MGTTPRPLVFRPVSSQTLLVLLLPPPCLISFRPKTKTKRTMDYPSQSYQYSLFFFYFHLHVLLGFSSQEPIFERNCKQHLVPVWSWLRGPALWYYYYCHFCGASCCELIN